MFGVRSADVVSFASARGLLRAAWRTLRRSFPLAAEMAATLFGVLSLVASSVEFPTFRETAPFRDAIPFALKLGSGSGSRFSRVRETFSARDAASAARSAVAAA